MGRRRRTVRGRHYRLAETLCSPRPLQPGGHADACNLFDVGPEAVAHTLAVLDRHCADVGRDPAQVRRTVVTGTDPLADVGAFVERARAYADLGVDRSWVGSSAPDLPAWVRRVGDEVLPELG